MAETIHVGSDLGNQQPFPISIIKNTDISNRCILSLFGHKVVGAYCLSSINTKVHYRNGIASFFLLPMQLH